MATNEYMEAIYVIPPIVGGVFFQVQYYIYANIVFYYKKPIYVMFGSMTATALNLILNYFFINRYGYIAAGYTTLFCYAIQAIIDYFAMKKVVGHDIYNMKIIMSLSALVVLISLFSNYLYSMPIVRYSVFCIIIMIMVCFRKKIVKVLLNIKNNTN